MCFSSRLVGDPNNADTTAMPYAEGHTRRNNEPSLAQECKVVPLPLTNGLPANLERTSDTNNSGANNRVRIHMQSAPFTLSVKRPNLECQQNCNADMHCSHAAKHCVSKLRRAPARYPPGTSREPTRTLLVHVHDACTSCTCRSLHVPGKTFYM